MKKITTAILLSLFSVSLFAQSAYPGDVMNPGTYKSSIAPPKIKSKEYHAGGCDFGMTFGKKIGIILSCAPIKMKGYGFFIDYKFADLNSDIDIHDVVKTIQSSREYYTWQTSYGSYTKETYETGTMLFVSDYISNNSISAGIVIPTNKKNLRFLVGGGFNIKKIKTKSSLNHYAALRTHSHYQLAGGDFFDSDIGSTGIDYYKDVRRYSITPNVTYGLIWGRGFTINAGFDTKFYSEGARTEFYIGFGFH